MFMVMLVIDDPGHLDAVLEAWVASGVTGVNILERTGLARRAAGASHLGIRFGFENLARCTEECHATLLAVVPDETGIASLMAETTELVRRYGLRMLWFDGQWEAPYTRERSLAFQRELRARFPRLVVNDRIEASGRMQPGDPGGDFATPEQRVGEYDTKRPWETCMTLGDQWAYRPNDRYKSLDQVLTILVQTVTGDGNLLLNVGPDAEGRIPPEQRRLLLGMGEWLGEHGQAVYGTRGGPFRNGAWGGATRKGRTVFLLVLDRKADQLTFPELPARVRSCRSLAPGMSASVESEGRGIRVRLSGARPEVGPAVIRLDLDRDAWSLGDLPGPSQKGTSG